ncbi:MAG: hypothetical protein LM550_14435 [Candidatus Contendobacter sp.]|nr:hypothetical protein [Gammaproteobacteria bacterium]MCC8994850.1 hypothetical protein [Candidatus Contendobacter sp.]
MEEGRREGRQEGLQEGLQKGIKEGRQEGESLIVQRLLAFKFGLLDQATLARLAAADSETLWIPKLRELHRKRFKSRIPADAAGRMQ